MVYAVNLSNYYLNKYKKEKQYSKKSLPRWSPELAYVIGLIVTDGNLSNDGRHIIFTSKDKELINHVTQVLGITSRPLLKTSGALVNKERRYYHLQFSHVKLYRFLNSLGIYKNKTKTINKINIPKKYFFHFLRGHFDGDGTFYSYYDHRWPKSYLYYLVFISASYQHLVWLRKLLYLLIKVKGSIVKRKYSGIYKLSYGKKEASIIIKKMYPTNDVVCLTRKRLKIFKVLAIVKQLENLRRGW